MAYEVRTQSNEKVMALATDAEFRKRMQEAVSEVLWYARNRASEDVQSYLKDSAHEAYRAVHNSVYRKIIGGNINILTQRKALRRGKVAPSWRGRSRKTEQMLSYYGPDRGMILRWLNSGTKNRWTVRMDGHPMYRNSVDERPKSRHYKYERKLGGRFGAARKNTNTIGMFSKVVNPKMEEAARKLDVLIEQIITELYF